MRIDQNPLFRKTISPWYDSEAICVGIITSVLHDHYGAARRMTDGPRPESRRICRVGL